MTYTLFTLLCSAINTIVLCRYYNYIFNHNKKHIVLELSSYVFCWVLNNIVYFYVNVPFIMAIYNICAFILLTVNYYDNWKKKVFSAIFFYSVLALIEGSVVFVTSKVSIAFFVPNQYNVIVGQIITSIFIFAFTEILLQRKNIARKVDMPNIYLFGLMITPVCTFVIINFLLCYNINLLSLSICAILFLVINMVVFYLYDKIIASVLQKKEHDVLVTQNRNLRFMVDNMQVSVENTRKLNHDLRNHATVMLALAESEKNEKLVEYIENTFQIPTGSFLSGGNVVVNSILNFKKQECEGKHIEPLFHVDIPSDVDIPDDVFTIVLGNLLDNAIAAVEKMSEDRKIYVDLFQERGIVYFYVGNPYCGELRMDEKQRYLTTKEDTEIHGYGIENVEQAVERNGGAVLIEHDDHRFHVIVALATHHE